MLMAPRTLQVAVVADLLEERWPSMDLMAEMVMAHVGRDGTPVSPVLLRPAFQPPLRMPRAIERYAQRFWSYPSWLRKQARADVYHVVDHSYAHLVSHLPANRTVVTCHDTDAFRTVLSPGQRESNLPRILVERVLRGLRRAAIVVCDSETVRAELLRHALLPEDRVVVVPIGAHSSFTAVPDAGAEAAAAALLPVRGGTGLLHVGSTIPRKRIEVLLNTLAAVVEQRPDVTLWRVGGDFTPAQLALVRRRNLESHVVVVPFVERPVLAALYRRAALVLLPSAREGFGLPIVEAMACGAPVLASDLPVLREVGGDAAEYCATGEPLRWAERVLALLAERDSEPARWAIRRENGFDRAAAFSWDRYGAEMSQVYARVAAGCAGDGR
jgi:glycosyltransferase involved in cell wall biosynthesis